MHCTNSIGRINGEMTLNSTLIAFNTFSRALMGQVSKEKSVTVQMEGWDVIQLDI